MNNITKDYRYIIILVVLSVYNILGLPCFWPDDLGDHFAIFVRSFWNTNYEFPQVTLVLGIISGLIYVSFGVLFILWSLWFYRKVLKAAACRYSKARRRMGITVYSLFVFSLLTFGIISYHKPRNLCIAIKWNDKAAIREMLANDVDVNALGDHGYAPLHTALLYAKYNVVELLVINGADPNVKTSEGKVIPLQLVLHYPNDRKIHIAQMLIDHGADIHQRDIARNTVLHTASFFSNELTDEVVSRLLLKNGAKVNVKNKFGQTPLHLAAHPMQGGVEPNVDNIELLLQHGADVNAIDKKGQTPLDIAIKNEHADKAVKTLRKHGGKTSKELGIKPAPATQPAG